MSEKNKLVGALNALKRIAEPIRAYHGTPHKFDRFDISKIGTGEGAQAYGHGLYFAENPEVAMGYKQRFERDMLDDMEPTMSVSFPDEVVGRQRKFVENALKNADGDVSRAIGLLDDSMYARPDASKDWLNDVSASIDALKSGKIRIDWSNDFPRANLYAVDLHVPQERLLDWDAPLSAQPHVLDALKSKGALKSDGSLSFMYNEVPRRGGEMYERLTSPLANRLTGGKGASTASNWLHDIGVPGVKYLDGSSRHAGTGTRNFVMFDDAPIEIVRRYARGGLNSMKETSNG